MRWLARRFRYTRETERRFYDLVAYVNALEEEIDKLCDLLPGDKKPIYPERILEAFGDKAVKDLGTLLAACLDYRRVLAQMYIPDPVSGRHEGVEAIADRYGVEYEKIRFAHGLAGYR